MGYYVRVLSKRNDNIPVTRLREKLKNEKYNFLLEIDDGNEEKWTQLTLLHLDQTPICVIERNDVLEGSLGKEEIGEFLEEIEDCKPKRAVKWLKKYLPEVKVIYAFQLLSGTETNNGWDIFGTLKEELWDVTGGIFQADAEGFSNEEGYHILWQFNDGVNGEWCMAVLDLFGNWRKFKMDLGNAAHKSSFFNGKVPKGVEIIE